MLKTLGTTSKISLPMIYALLNITTDCH